MDLNRRLGSLITELEAFFLIVKNFFFKKCTFRDLVVGLKNWECSSVVECVLSM
jgi:hypothetical protein